LAREDWLWAVTSLHLHRVCPQTPRTISSCTAAVFCSESHSCQYSHDHLSLVTLHDVLGPLVPTVSWIPKCSLSSTQLLDSRCCPPSLLDTVSLSWTSGLGATRPQPSHPPGASYAQALLVCHSLLTSTFVLTTPNCSSTDGSMDGFVGTPVDSSMDGSVGGSVDGPLITQSRAPSQAFTDFSFQPAVALSSAGSHLHSLSLRTQVSIAVQWLLPQTPSLPS
jgi:hypothetical protein